MTYRQHLRRARHLAVVFGYPVSLPWQLWNYPSAGLAARLATPPRRRQRQAAPVPFREASPVSLTVDAPPAMPVPATLTPAPKGKRTLLQKLFSKA
jgi:hypothetical protein